MRNIKAASRYATALIDLSIEQNALDKTYADIVSLQKTIEGSKELQGLLNSPIVKADKKKDVLNALFGKIFTELSVKYLDLLVKNGREALLPEITNQFIAQYNEKNNILKAEVITAIKLDDATRQKVLSLIKHDGKVEITETVNPNIIGGFVVKVGDKQIDASVVKKFKDLRKEIILN